MVPCVIGLNGKGIGEIANEWGRLQNPAQLGSLCFDDPYVNIGWIAACAEPTAGNDRGVGPIKVRAAGRCSLGWPGRPWG